jgi:UDP-N-acetylglucosamine 2-epimerase (non-hydrolysing)
MKIAPIIRAIEAARESGKDIDYRLIHTGQHYDKALSGDFFSELGIPNPDINLEVGSGTQAQQAAKIMLGYEEVLEKEKPDLCLVVGDVTSTMATAIVAQKAGVKVAHVEGGIRSNDWTMPEEINRLVTDSISDWFFTTSEHANENLAKAGVDSSRVYFVGNTMIDTLLHNMERLQAPQCWEELGLSAGEYIVLTLHRPSNVDDLETFSNSLREISTLAGDTTVVYPAHPRTHKSLEKFKLPTNLKMISPEPYLSFNYLVKNSLAVITDSGGITEETTVMGIPCMTLRDNTERPETVGIGMNELVGSDPSNLKPHMQKLFAGEWKQGGIPDKWDGKTAVRIVEILVQLLCK